jgi:DNA polymerase-3 subunit epsilon
MPQKIQAWPYPGAIGIREYQSETQQSDIHIISHWCYLGTVQSEAELDSFAMPSSLNLDKDFYRLCLQQLEKNPQVLDLSNILSGMSN